MLHLYGIHTRSVAERIVEAFRNPESLPKALAPVFIHRKDDTPCRKWSWQNQLLIALANTCDARGIQQWNAVGRSVKKGAKAIWILAPCLRKVALANDEGEEVSKQVLYGFRSIPVFAIDDTEGEPISSDDPYKGWIESLPLFDVAKSWGVTVDTYSHKGSGPLGYYAYGPSHEAIKLGVENLSTWAHELVHAADNRLTGLKDAKWCREIVAELGGCILLECLGQSRDADLGGAFEYISSYAQQAKKEAVSACIEVLGRVCECVKLILETAESSCVQAA